MRTFQIKRLHKTSIGTHPGFCTQLWFDLHANVQRKHCIFLGLKFVKKLHGIQCDIHNHTIVVWSACRCSEKALPFSWIEVCEKTSWNSTVASFMATK
jgi:hypothetical protein